MQWKKYHRVVSLVILLPLVMIAVTGVLLQLRNQFEEIQPKTIVAGRRDSPYVSFESVLAQYGRDEIDQIILKPGKNNLALRMKDGMEIQLHPQTGELLKSAPRRTGFLIDLHQGSWMGNIGQYFIHLPAAFGLIFLIVSGVMIYPFKKKRS